MEITYVKSHICKTEIEIYGKIEIYENCDMYDM